MKNFFPLSLTVLLLLSTTAISQTNKQCDTPNNETSLDFNTISKCAIEKDKDNSNNVILNVAAKKTRKRIVRKREKVTSLDGNTKDLNTDVTESQLEIKNDIVTKRMEAEVVLFNIVENVPLFPDCEKNSNNSKDCFNDQFSNHFANTFDPERASEEGVTGRVFIQFTIDTKGQVIDLLVKARKKDNLLESEIKRVINKLPNFSPGRHKGLPVNVKYSLPINFSAE